MDHADLSLPPIGKKGNKRLPFSSSPAVAATDYNVENLVVAALCGDVVGLTAMLNQVDEDGQACLNVDGIHAVLRYTALHAAAEFGQLATTRVLVDKGADVNARCARAERTPLFYAAQHRRSQIARFLISKGANRRLRDAEGLRAYQLVEVASEEDDLLRDFLLDPPGRVPAVILKASTHDSLRLEWNENLFDKDCSRIDSYAVRWRVKLPTAFLPPTMTATAITRDLTAAAGGGGEGGGGGGRKRGDADGEWHPRGRRGEGWVWDTCNARTFHISGLLPATDYLVQVAAHSQVGYGPPSRPISYRTRETVPDPPASAPMLVRPSPNSVLLCVRPPERDNGWPVSAYTVHYRLYATVGPGGVETKVPRPIWHSYGSASPDNHFTVPMLYASSKYVFKARAENLAGAGDFSAESQPILTGYPVQVVSKTASSVMITWVSHPLRDATSFDLQMRSLLDQGDLRSPFLPLADGLTENCYEVKELLPASYYQFRVRANYARDVEEWEDAAVSGEVRTDDDRPFPPSEPVLVPNSIMQTSATFQWEVQRANGQPVVEHELSASYKVNQWFIIGTGTTATMCAQNLPVNRRLFFRARVRNSIGWSDYSLESRCLEIFVVPPPSTPVLVSSGISWIELTFDPPPGFQVESYQLRMRRVVKEGHIPPPVSAAPMVSVSSHGKGKGEEDDDDDEASGQGWKVHPMTRTAGGKSLHVHDLTALSTFEFQVRGQTVLGWSRWSGVSQPMTTSRRM